MIPDSKQRLLALASKNISLSHIYKFSPQEGILVMPLSVICTCLFTLILTKPRFQLNLKDFDILFYIRFILSFCYFACTLGVIDSAMLHNQRHNKNIALKCSLQQNIFSLGCSFSYNMCIIFSRGLLGFVTDL